MIIGLAPMDGITDLPYRTIVQNIFAKYNKDNTLRTRTEFMNADGYMTHPSKLIRHLIHHDHEPKLIAQIYGGNEDTLVKTAIDIEEKYPSFFGIELNIGCPSPKVMACGGGSGMMRDKKATLQIIKNISEAIQKPFSIKVRAGLDDNDKQTQEEFIMQAAQYCQTISIHGRTFKQGHSGDVDRTMIHRIKKNIANSCTIIGNGGIKTYQEIMEHQTQLDGIMVAQAAIGNPRVLTPHEPTHEERFQTIYEHLDLLTAYERYFKEKIKEYPEEPYQTQLQQNQHKLHAIKIAEDDDSIVHVASITKHDRKFPFPKIEELQDRINNLYQMPEDIYNNLRGTIEFRKYLFNYIKTIPGSKDLKIQVASIKDYKTLKQAIQDFQNK